MVDVELVSACVLGFLHLHSKGFSISEALILRESYRAPSSEPGFPRL